VVILDAAAAYRGRLLSSAIAAPRRQPVSGDDFDPLRSSSPSWTRASWLRRVLFSNCGCRATGEIAAWKDRRRPTRCADDHRGHHARRQHQGKRIADARTRRRKLRSSGNEQREAIRRVEAIIGDPG